VQVARRETSAEKESGLRRQLLFPEGAVLMNCATVESIHASFRGLDVFCFGKRNL